MKVLGCLLFILLASVPALAKPWDVYPVSCDDLWGAVDHALSDTGNYAVIAEDAVNKKASLVVVGSLVVFKDKVALKPADGGCQMKLTFIQIGPDNSDERGFRKRVVRSLAKMQTAKAAAPAKPAALHAGSK